MIESGIEHSMAALIKCIGPKTEQLRAQFVPEIQAAPVGLFAKPVVMRHEWVWQQDAELLLIAPIEQPNTPSIRRAVAIDPSKKLSSASPSLLSKSTCRWHIHVAPVFAHAKMEM